MLTDKKILVTGGTGSLGKVLVKRLLSGELGMPKKIIVFSRDEAKQHSMRIEYLNKKDPTDEIIYNNSNDNNITLFAFDANQKLSEHKAPFDAFVQILEGNAQIIINKQTFNLSEGQAIIMPANISHAINANEKFKMLLIMIK